VLMVMEEECLVGEKIIVRVSEREEEESFASGECVVVCIVAERWWARERESRRSVCSVGIVGAAWTRRCEFCLYCYLFLFYFIFNWRLRDVLFLVS
jgi:hypothetical protein